MLPALFISHGSPTLPLTQSPATRFLQGLAANLAERPRAILVVSAHWQTAAPVVSAVAINDTIHDFYGFPPELYALRYPAPGSAALAARVQDLLAEAGMACATDRTRGLDHGAWVPLLLMYPGHDIPVAQLSVQTHLGPSHAWRIGRALAALRAEGVLVIGSGSFTHDLSEFGAYRDAPEAPEPDWVSGFARWFDQALAEHRLQDLLDYRSLSPGGAKNHPTEDHLLPLFAALGAGGPGVQRLHASTTHGVLRMDVYAFGTEQLRKQPESVAA
jgi:4,5-DOPA dioxygenase extradiol